VGVAVLVAVPVAVAVVELACVTARGAPAAAEAAAGNSRDAAIKAAPTAVATPAAAGRLTEWVTLTNRNKADLSTRLLGSKVLRPLDYQPKGYE
jgi:hypothetical protein